ncbi:MAG: hypothetical protein P1V97_30085 [Planctomycetota bacterium]|nr:hypothetical protein [Planctomycetota bacterium]
MTKKAKFSTKGYRSRWDNWSKDPLLKAAGITFDRTPAGEVKAPEGKVRVCAYHIDWDERPTLFMDVGSKAEAEFVVENFHKVAGGMNVDYAIAYDEKGDIVASDRPY